MASVAPTLKITQDQIDFYRREGYLVLDALTSQEEVEWLKGVYDKLFERRAGREEGMQFDLAGTDEEGKEAALPQILNPAKFAPELLEGLFRANAEVLVKALLGPEARVDGEHAIMKPPRTGAATPWHQDEAYWPPENEYDSLSIWIPLQPATIENGCMAFVPKSHNLEIIEHRPIGGDVRVHGLETVQTEFEGAVFCPIPAGGCTVHSSRTLHYAGPNVSDMPRRAYILTAGVPPKPRTDGRRFPWQEMQQTARKERAEAAKN